MNTATATELKNRLGPLLATAQWAPVAIKRHGKVVAYLVPAGPAPAQSRRSGMPKRVKWGRAKEERLLELCSSRDFRPSRWARAGDREFLAGVAAVLASLPEFPRPRLLALAERLSPGMNSVERFGDWLRRSPLDPARFVPMLRERMAHGAGA
jgi:antitoxin (DNA-binding transcriptional repressor) of toxin-antitoxin stability system